MLNEEKKNSINNRILRVVWGALILFAAAMAAVSVLIVHQLAKEDASLLLSQVCEEETLRADSKIDMVQHSVSMIYEYINEMNAANETVFFSDKYSESIRKFAISVANQTEGGMAVYYRYNPELVGNGTGGFFWSRPSEEDMFREEIPTDILQYNMSDVERVGWYYIPKDSGKPLWMSPYYNQNLDVFMISYVIPVYSGDDEFLGVVGMDIDFNSIMNTFGNRKIYETGSLSLADLSERLVYRLENGSTVSEKLDHEWYNHITTINRSSDLLQVTEKDGTEKIICCERLSNSMVLFVDVPVEEIYANRNQLSIIMIALTFAAVLLTSIVTARATLRITGPINKLAEITGQYAKGDWEHEYICDTGDELQNLSESISVMSKNTQKYLSEINHLAMTDALTGVKNKTSYLEWIENIKRNEHNAYDEYGVVVMDLNLLKTANDKYGHEAGDALIYEASRYICRIFSHSPVFRIGGDEFAAIMTDMDYDNRQELCIQFEKEQGYEVEGAHGIKLSIAYGLATCPDDAFSFEEVFKNADDRMYMKKKEMKVKRYGDA